MKGDKDEGGSPNVDKKSLMWILLTLADVEKGEGGKMLFHKMWIICFFV